MGGGGVRAAGLLAAVALIVAGASAPVEARSAADTGGATAQQIRKVTGLAGSNDDDSGRVFRLGIAYDLKAAGAEALDGAELAVAHIQAAGGPEIDLVVEDIGQPGNWQGVAAENALRAAGTPLALVAGSAAGGTMLPGLERDHILAFDGDLGVTGATRGQPFLWGFRPGVPDDDIAVALQYLATAYPKAHSIALAYAADEPGGPMLLKTFALALADIGVDLAGALPIGDSPAAGQDLADRLRQLRPDAVYVAGGSALLVLGAVKSAGLNIPVVGTDRPIVAPDELSALDGYVFAADWFDATQVTNDWAQLFVTSYRRRFGADPGGPAANAYEETFAVWALIRRVLARAGDISDGARLQQELVANHAFKSLYGGDGADLDQIVLDPATHDVLERPFSVYRVLAGGLHRVASSDFGGANFALEAR